MSGLLTLEVLGALTLVLFLLALWQQKIAQAEREGTLAEIHKARERGTDRAVAQHPQIDVQACIGCGTCITACPEEGVLGLVEGVAHVIHGSRCIGHARCAEACPIGAIVIGLGDTPVRPDIPVLSESLESSVPGIYVAGELGGLALIRIANEQGTLAVDEIARDLVESSSNAEVLDLLIVGAGPAGIAASLRAKERGLHFLTIDMEDLGGTIRKYPRRKLTLVGEFRLPMYGKVDRDEFLKEELIEFYEQVIVDYGLDSHMRSGVRLNGVEPLGDLFLAHTSHGDIHTRRILLALGRRGTPRKLGVPGEDTEKVLYQLIDAATYTDQHVLVVGGGDSAIETATGLANQAGNVVTLSYRREEFFRLKPRNEDRIARYAGKNVRVIFNSDVQQVDEDSVTLACREEGEETTLRLKNDFVFVMAGGEPPYALLRSIGLRLGGDEDESPTSPVSDTVAAAR